jgi:hypothetical protein
MNLLRSVVCLVLLATIFAVPVSKTDGELDIAKCTYHSTWVTVPIATDDAQAMASEHPTANLTLVASNVFPGKHPLLMEFGVMVGATNSE